MIGINNLKELLKNMKPELNKKEFVFVTMSADKFNDLIQESIDPKMIFEEKEGITLILEKNKAKTSLERAKLFNEEIRKLLV